MRAIKLPIEFEKMLPGPVASWFRQYLEPAIRKVDTQVVLFGTAGTEVRVRHQLGAVPSGYRVIDQSAAGSVYRDANTTAATDRFLWLKSDTASLTVTLEIL